jgi:predicted permease
MKHAIRVLAREKAFTCFAVLTLALGIGAVTTISSVVHGVLLRPLAYTDPGRLYAASEFAAQFATSYPRLPVNAAHFNSWQKQCRSCLAGAILQPASFNLTGEGEPERVDGVQCSWQLFHVLGIRPQLGRTFVESDDQPGANRYVVITDSLWRRRLNADPNVIGKSIRLYGEPHVVTGVLSPDFRFPAGDQFGAILVFPKHTEIFKPLGVNWAKSRRIGSFNYSAVVRLRPGATPERAQSEMTAAIADAGQEMKTELKAFLTPLHDQVTGGSREALWLLLGAVGAVLLIVCVNLGNLMLVRASGRLREAAIRRALGAGVAQLFRPIMTESLLIAFIGGAFGVLLAQVGVRLLVSVAPIDIPRLDEVRVNTATMLFALCISAGCGILCGVWPALRLTRSQAADALKSGSRSATEGRSKLRAREWLVALEVALSTVLLVVASLLGVSFLRLMNAERGFDVERILTADLTLPGSRYPKDEQKAAFHQQTIDRLETLPGVKSAALISSLPLKAQIWGDVVSKEGEARPMIERPLAHFRFISPHYFDVMGIALRRGSIAAEGDRARKVAVISESVAQKVWPGEDAIGKRIRKNDEPKTPWVEVIGVVADVRTVSLDKQPPLIVYVPYWDGTYWQGGVWGNATYLLRTAQDPSAMAGAFRNTVRNLDSELPLANVRTMREIVSESVGRRRFQTLLAAVFAVSALLLACLGIYGVISYGVDRRTNEMGIRMALGAQPSQVAGMVLRQGMQPVLGGLLLGVLGSLWAGQLLSSLIYGIGARDPGTICAVMIVLSGVAAAACWIPARRASRIDPASALRYE